MSDFETGDRVRFNKSATDAVRDKTGVISKSLGVEHITLNRLEQGKMVYSGLYVDVTMFEVKLDDSGDLYVAPESWLDKLV